MKPVTNISRLLCLGLVAGLAGCADADRSARSTAPQPAIEAGIELSNAAPVANSDITVWIRLRGPKSETMASFTGGLAYDTLGMTYLGEAALDDGATRVSNPQPGLIRAAGIRADGFGDVPLAGYRFHVREPAAVARMLLTIEEVHDANRADAASNVRVTPNPRIIR